MITWDGSDAELISSLITYIQPAVLKATHNQACCVAHKLIACDVVTHKNRKMYPDCVMRCGEFCCFLPGRLCCAILRHVCLLTQQSRGHANLQVRTCHASGKVFAAAFTVQTEMFKPAIYFHIQTSHHPTLRVQARDGGVTVMEEYLFVQANRSLLGEPSTSKGTSVCLVHAYVRMPRLLTLPRHLSVMCT